MITHITRLFFGFATLVLVWFATWPFEDGKYSPMLLAGLSGILLSALASRVAVALNKHKSLYAFMFAIPFALPTAISALAIFNGIFRPFLFWLTAGILATIVAWSTDLLMKNLFKPNKNALPGHPPRKSYE